MSNKNPNTSGLRPNPNWVKGVSQNPHNQVTVARARVMAVKLLNTLESSGVDPIHEIIMLLKDPEVAKSDKLRNWVSLMPYLYPRVKEIPADESDELRNMVKSLSKEELTNKLEAYLNVLKRT